MQVTQHIEVIESVATRLNGFFYRCRNDASYTMLFMTPAIERITGFPVSDLLGNRVRTFTSIVHADDAPVVDAKVAEALAARSNWEVDYRLLTKSGGTVWVHESGAGIFDDNGELQYLEGAVVDISQQKAHEFSMSSLITKISGSSQAIMRETQGILGELKMLTLLALNARIEAARAGGSAGAGFGVVAQEMKTLADATREAADRINTLMDELQSLVSHR